MPAPLLADCSCSAARQDAATIEGSRCQLTTSTSRGAAAKGRSGRCSSNCITATAAATLPAATEAAQPPAAAAYSASPAAAGR